MMTNVEWQDVLKGLRQVPLVSRCASWEQAVTFVEKVVHGKNDLVPELDPDIDYLRFSVRCSLCKCFIKVGEDFVHKAASGTYHHYDCHCRS
jgi:hypothetical protein